MKKIVVTIDGPAGSGKSTISNFLGNRLGLPCVDTGATYRYTAYLALDNGIDLEDEDAIAELAEEVTYKVEGVGEDSILKATWCNQTVNLSEGVDHERIRMPQVAMGASDIAVYPKVRKVLVRKQQEIAQQGGGIVNGRDAGTVICPDAPFKFFLTADPEVRAKRRLEDLVASLGQEYAPPYVSILADVKKRDHQDENRKVGALKPAKNAIMVDSSNLDIAAVVELMAKHVES